ncbi:MAG: pyridoxamine 5'-phosphate oxidase family protein [bacterium]|nr:pyridoxamine 5'-phosphate oxidase family protein [bacterium]
MTNVPFSDVAFTPAVKAAQEARGSRHGYASMEQRGGWSDTITPDLAAFVAARDSIYVATATAEGQPYVQHRGGPPGFLKVLDEHRLAFADYSGNQQYVSLGNLSENDRAFLFLMDYEHRQRIKVWGRAEFIEDDPELLAQVADPGYPGTPQRVFVFHVEAWDRNCPQHITPRLGLASVEARESALRERIDELAAENAKLRAAAADRE